jgi:hypothetical protein
MRALVLCVMESSQSSYYYIKSLLLELDYLNGGKEKISLAESIADDPDSTENPFDYSQLTKAHHHLAQHQCPLRGPQSQREKIIVSACSDVVLPIPYSSSARNRRIASMGVW